MYGVQMQILPELREETVRMDKKIHCECGKLLAKIHEDGTIWVWCKSCKKEVPLAIEHESPQADFIMGRFMRVL